MTRSNGLWILLAVLAVAIAGCGDSEEDALTKSAFIKQADAICKKADLKQMAALKKAAEDQDINAMSPAEQADLAVEIVLPAVRDEAEEIGELNPPKADEEGMEKFVEEIERAADEGEANPPRLGTGPRNVFISAEQMAKQYGFTDCVDVS